MLLSRTPGRKVTISPRPSRVSQLRVLTTTLKVATSSKLLVMRAPTISLTMILEVALAEAEGRAVDVTHLTTVLRRSQAATSRSLACHVEVGCLETYQDERDARRTYVRLTATGHAFVQEVLDAMRDVVILEREKQAQEV